ncbi:hypothetical protein BC829DRAFT_383383 [Chytridium lagenaria]|nr:hypothetical protein BC829DRAFT_383383 [Chytridium lagenaria]
MVFNPSKFGPSPPTSPQLLPSPASIPNAMPPRMTSSNTSPPSTISYANRSTSPTESVPSVTSSSTSSGSALSKYYQSRGWKCTSAPTASVPAGPSAAPSSTAGVDAHIRYDHVIRSLRPALPSYRASQVAHTPQPSEQPLPKLPAKRSLLDLKLPALPESEPVRMTRNSSCFAITQVTGCDAETFALCADFDSLLED